ncbi:MAG: hypothetical protein FWD89_04725, partial [Firmicutes bacterium]|nr:hypothetical protein [Bacillota bacterium]
MKEIIEQVKSIKNFKKLSLIWLGCFGILLILAIIALLPAVPFPAKIALTCVSIPFLLFFTYMLLRVTIRILRVTDKK